MPGQKHKSSLSGSLAWKFNGYLLMLFDLPRCARTQDVPAQNDMHAFSQLRLLLHQRTQPHRIGASRLRFHSRFNVSYFFIISYQSVNPFGHSFPSEYCMLLLVRHFL
ncbi:hypothetical protein EK21DRAFT_83912 [Setomelanomma holmii]|uniref:Uncharacterized protein n=1 Tax=Setomelanomma holmii TaxID=210430 RepID=A0A9P4HKV0_9PLEO|nr:hypothetical protein EK21DRAFT_83912 [Setomelanomma holmii]